MFLITLDEYTGGKKNEDEYEKRKLKKNGRKQEIKITLYHSIAHLQISSVVNSYSMPTKQKRKKSKGSKKNKEKGEKKIKKRQKIAS